MFHFLQVINPYIGGPQRKPNPVFDCVTLVK